MDEEKKKKQESFISETGAPKGDIGTGNGISPTTGQKTYSSGGGSSRGTTTNYGSYEDDLNRLTEAKRKAQITALDNARKNALANLDVQEQSIAPTYNNARNQVSATSQKNAKSFAEYMANRGLTNSGAAAQGEMNRQSTLSNNLGNLDTAEANARRDIANQRTQVENDYTNGVASANAGIDADYYNNLLNYNQQQRQYVQGLQQQALGQYSNDYQAQINNLLAQGYSPNSLEVLQLQALRGDKVNNQYSMGQQNAMNNILAGNINYNNAAAMGMTTEQAQQYYNNYQAQQQAQAQAQQQELERQMAQQEFENYIKQQQLQNATALNNSNIAKNQASINNINSQIANRNSSKTSSTSNAQISTKDLMSLLSNVPAENAMGFVDNLYISGQIDDNTLANAYAWNGWNLN